VRIVLQGHSEEVVGGAVEEGAYWAVHVEPHDIWPAVAVQVGNDRRLAVIRVVQAQLIVVTKASRRSLQEGLAR